MAPNRPGYPKMSHNSDKHPTYQKEASFQELRRQEQQAACIEPDNLDSRVCLCEVCRLGPREQRRGLSGESKALGYSSSL